MKLFGLAVLVLLAGCGTPSVEDQPSSSMRRSAGCCNKEETTRRCCASGHRDPDRNRQRPAAAPHRAVQQAEDRPVRGLILVVVAVVGVVLVGLAAALAVLQPARPTVVCLLPVVAVRPSHQASVLAIRIKTSRTIIRVKAIRPAPIQATAASRLAKAEREKTND
jgi:hypothetical protein